MKRRACRAIVSSLFLCLCLHLCLLCPAVPADATVVGSITVQGLSSAGRAELLSMLGLSEGAQIDAGKVQAGIKRAFLKGIFEDIAVVTNDRDPADVTVIVRERDMIGKISVRGEHALSAKRVRNFLLFKAEDIMRYDLMAEAERDLKEKYALSGYPDAVVRIHAEKMKEPYRVELVVTVESGPPSTISGINITGTDVVTPDDLRLSAGDIYDQFKVREELKRIQAKLRKDGYYHPAAGPYIYEAGILTIRLDPGRRLTVIIEGNSAISTKRLQKEVPFFEVEAVNDEIVDEAVIRILSLYHSEGYPFAQVAPVLKQDKNTIEVSFFVYEGPRIKTRSIRVTGSTLPLESLKNVMGLKEGEYFNPDLKERDRETLQEFYRALGFLEVTIREIEDTIDREKERADITVVVEEGMRTLIGSIDIKGVTDEARARLLAVGALKVGDPYNEVDISDARFRMIDSYVNDGNLNVDVLAQRTIEDHKASVVFTVVEGTKIHIGKMVIAGNQRTRYEVIRREVARDEGHPYSFRTLAEERRKLYKLGLFDDVEIEPYNAGDGVKDLLVKVKEGNAGAYEFGVGYADYEQFRGYAEISYRNLWGMNRQGLLRGELSSLQRRFITQYTEPWFLGRELPFRVLFLYENKKEISFPEREVRYRIERYSASAGVEKQITKTLKAEFYYEYSIVRTTEVQPDVVLSKEDVGTLAISALRPSLVFDTRDNPFDPTRGIVAGLSVKIASSLLFSETDFVKMTLYGSSFHQLHKRLVLALSARGGIAYGYGDTTELPLVERFFLGGRFSVRGYEQDTLGPKGADDNPTGGNAFAMGSVELRTYVGKGLSIVPFLDFGNVWVKVSDFKPSDIKYTAGLGLRYGTPVGPLRVDYGYKLNKEKNESSGELHFSIGHAF
ncbi:MAG: outer membrane protein assembly factor BamA [Nitrospirae bacterium]|nr:outer membrane protein assembly factor BamA [Nitrospirota bacterium]